MPIYRTTAPLIEYCKKLQNFKNHFGVVEAAGSNPVTQTKRPLLERGAVLCFIGDIWLTEWLCEHTFVVGNEYPYNFRAFLKFLLHD